MPHRRIHATPILAAAILAFPPLLLIHSAAGATDDWVGHLINLPPLIHTYNGTFSDGVNWSTAAPPGAADTAQFNASATYTVSFSNSPTNAALNVSAGVVTFIAPVAIPTYTVGTATVTGGLTLSDFQLKSNGTVSVGGTAGSLTVMSDAQGSGASQLTSGNIDVAAAAFGLTNSATLTVTGPRAFITQNGAATLDVGSSLIARSGAGVLHVDNGALFTSGTGLTQVHQTGTINIAGGTFVGNGNVSVIGGRVIGDAAASFQLAIGSQFNLTAGGRADFANNIFFTANSTTVDGSTSHFNNSAYTYVGSGGHSSAMVWQNGATGTLGGLFVGGTTAANSTGTVFIQSGASVTSNNTGIGDFNAAGQIGTVTVTGPGSTLTLGAPGMTIGAGLSSGTLNVNSGGVVNANGNTNVRGMGHVSIAGGTYNSSNLTLSAALQSDAAGTFTLAAGGHLSISSGGHADLNGPVTAPGGQITVDGASSHLNMAEVLSLGDGGLSGSLTLTNAATAGLTGGLQLDSGASPSGNGAATVQSGGHLTVGNLSIGAGGLTGQVGTLTVTGANSQVTQSILNHTTVGAAANSAGTVNIASGGTFTPSALTINATGAINVTGGTFQANGGFTLFGGSVQSDSAGTVNFGSGASVDVQSGGAVDLNGTVAMDSATVTVTGTASHFNVARPVALGNGLTGGSGFVTFQNNATGNFPGGLSLDETFNTSSSASIQSGAQVTSGNLGVGADGTSTSSTPQLFISGAGSSLTQTGAATLNVGTFSATGTSFGLMKVQNGGTFTSGTGPTLVSVNSTIEVLGGIYNANGDITFRGSTFQQDAAGRFALAPGKTISFTNDAMININGAFTGGNVDNEVSIQVNGGQMVVQSFDGAGDATIAAGAQLTADHIRQASLTLSGNAAVRAQPVPDSDASASSFSRLTILAAGQFDLTDNRLTISYVAGHSPVATIRSYLVTGYNNGAWNGPGISSSAASGSHALGYADSADGVVAGLGVNTVLVKFTRVGDLNLDGVVNFTDLLILAQHYGQPDGNWDQGDVNYDGMVNFTDLLGLAQNYGGTLSAAQLDTFTPSFRSDVATAFAQVPEPATVGVLLAGAILLWRRSRR